MKVLVPLALLLVLASCSPKSVFDANRDGNKTAIVHADCGDWVCTISISGTGSPANRSTAKWVKWKP